MKEGLREIVRGQGVGPGARNLVREFLQAQVLGALQRAGAMVPLAFQGGTALRFLHGIRRYSEDLDFALERPGAGYDFRSYLDAIRADLEREGYRVEIGRPSDRKVVHSAFVRFPGLLHEMGLSGQREEALSVKLEVDTRPPAGARDRDDGRAPARAPAAPAPRPRLSPGRQAPRGPAPALAQGPRLLRSRLVPERPVLARPEPGPAERRSRADGVERPVAHRGHVEWARSGIGCDAVKWDALAADVGPLLESPEDRGLVTRETVTRLLDERETEGSLEVMTRRLLAVLLLLAAPATLPAQEPAPAELSRRGSELMAAGRYADAVPVYRDLVKAVPGNAGLLLNLGMALHLSGQDGEAVAPLEAALKLTPDSAPASLFLGASRMRLGQTAAAVEPLRKAVRLQPESREARSMLADALVALDRHAEAEPHLRRLSRADPKDPVVWFALGKTYEALAGQAFGRLLERAPESPLTLALVAEARLDQGQTTAAFQLYRQALERAPSQRGLHAGVAEVYRRTGHPDWAAVEDEKERRLPKADCARDTLECAFAAGKHREVLSAASKLETPASSYWLARAANALAVEAFARLTALPPSAPSHEWRASMERNEGRYAEAAEEWRKAIALAPGEARLKLELAVTLRLNQDLPGAQQVLEGVLREGGDSPEACYLLGDVLLARQQPEPAIRLLEKAVRLEPRLAEAHGALGRAYALVGRPADAVPHLEQALATDQDGSLRYQLARSYQATGRADDARRALADYEEFRKAVGAGSEAAGEAATITPP